MPKEKRSWSITFRESTVLFAPRTYQAKSLRSAVRKARKDAWKEGNRSWSVYHVTTDSAGKELYGPFPYNKKWGKR